MEDNAAGFDGTRVKHRFTGHEKDFAIGIYYANARYYDQRLGRFISCDPAAPDLGDPQSLNPYAYCQNNPLKYVDPTGRFIIPVLLGVAAAVVTVSLLYVGAVNVWNGYNSAADSASKADASGINKGLAQMNEGRQQLSEAGTSMPGTSLDPPIPHNIVSGPESAWNEGVAAYNSYKEGDTDAGNRHLINVGVALLGTLNAAHDAGRDIKAASDQGGAPSPNKSTTPGSETQSTRGVQSGSAQTGSANTLSSIKVTTGGKGGESAGNTTTPDGWWNVSPSSTGNGKPRRTGPSANSSTTKDHKENHAR